MEKETKEKVSDATVYEASVILLPSLAESEVSSTVDSLKRIITELDGAVISFEDPVLIDLAYSMTKVTPTSRTKVDRGYFGWIKFELSSEQVGKLKSKLDENSDVVRYLLVKTVRENTLLGGKMKFHKEERSKKDVETTPDSSSVDVLETTSEELDKSIDELVIV